MKRNFWKIAIIFLTVIIVARSLGLKWSVLGQSLGLKKEVSVLPENKKLFGLNEKVKIKLNNQDGQNLKAKLIDKNKTELSVEIVEKSESGISEFELSPPPQFKPGKYTLEITDEAGKVITQDFNWGVLAINFNKAIYTLGEKANIAMAVLDEKGAMVCGAKVMLTITSPSGQKSELSTDNGRIIVNPECQSKEYTQKPDYQAEYEVLENGDFTVELRAETENGEYSISDAFRAEAESSFEVERLSATRIFPVQSYEMKINIVANEDFKGNIYEPVPSSFGISQLSEVVEYKAVNNEDKNNKIVWQVDLKKGDKISLGYQYKAPEISPQFYLTGPLTMMTLTDLVYSEGRQWQIAADAITPAKIRQEINIIDGQVTTEGTDAAIINLDTSKYNGATYFFEIIANKGAGTTLTVNLSTGNTNTVGIGISNTSNVLVRKQFTPENGSFDYGLNLTTGTTPTVKVARIIILQNANTITNTQTQIEIGNLEVGLSMATTTPLTSPKYWTYTSSAWQVGTTFYAELTYKQSANVSAGSTSFSNAGNYNWMAPAKISSVKVELWGGGGAGGGATTRYYKGGGGAGGQYIVKQVGVTSGNTYVVGVAGTVVGTTGNGGIGLTTTFNGATARAMGGAGGIANAGVGGTGSVAGGVGDTVYKGGNGVNGATTSGAAVGGGGGGAGSGGNGGNGSGLTGGTGTSVGGGDGGTRLNVQGNGSVGSDAGGGGSGGYKTDNKTTFHGGDGANGRADVSWSGLNYNTNFYLQEDNGSFTGWTNLVTIGTGLTGIVPNRLRSGSFTPTSGRHYRIVGNINDVTGTFDIYNAKIVADQSNPAGITKFEAQYLMLNTKSTTTGSVLGYQTLWDSTEWARTTNVYKHAADSIGVGTSAQVVDTSNSNTLVTGSKVMGAGQTISGNLTMPTTGNYLDSWLLGAGEVDASRILVQVSITAPAAENSPTVVLNSLGVGQTITSKTPTFDFTGTDVESDDIEYNIQIGTTDSFISPLLSKFSVSDVGFSNPDNGADTHPFTSGNNIQYTVQVGNSLAPGTYYWRVAGLDPAGTNTYGAWSSVRSFTVESAISYDQASFRWSNDDGGEVHGTGGSYNLNWDYRTPVVITNSLGTTLTDFEVKIDVGTSSLVADGKMNSDCGDVRLTANDQVTPLSYWIESGCNTSSTRIWVKVPILPNGIGTTVYMFYGNVGTTTTGVGTSTFLGFDDFGGSSLGVGWTTALGIWNISGGTLSQTDLTSGEGKRIYRNIGYTGAVSVEAKMLPITYGTDHRMGPITNIDLGSANKNGVVATPRNNVADQDCVLLDGVNWWCSTLLPFSFAQGNWYKLMISAIQIGNSGMNYAKAWPFGTTEPVAYDVEMTSTYTAVTTTNGIVGINGGYNSSVAVDYWFAHKYEPTVPTVSVGSEVLASTGGWLAAENVGVTGVAKNSNIRLRFSVNNTGDSGGVNLRLQMAPLGGAGSCEAVARGNFVDVPTTAGVGTSLAIMTTSANFTDQEATTEQLTPSSTTFVAGKMVEASSNQTNSITLSPNTYTEAEYNFQFTSSAAEATAYCFRTRNATTDLNTYSHVAMATVAEAWSGPIMDQIMRHGTWFLNGVKQFFTF